MREIIKVLLISILIFLICPKSVSAAGIDFTSLPSSVTILEKFEIYLTFSSLENNTPYYIKAVGGNSFYDVQTFNQNNDSYLSWNTSWTEFPQFTTNDSGAGTTVLKCRFKADSASSDNQFKITIRKVGTDDNINSEIVTIRVVPAPTNTATPTSEPVSTSTPIPTKNPTPTGVPSATKTPTPKPTTKVINMPTSTPKVLSTDITSTFENERKTTGEVLGQQEVTSVSSTSGKDTNEKTKQTLISGAKISLVLGLLFCGIAIMIFTQRFQEMRKPNDKT